MASWQLPAGSGGLRHEPIITLKFAFKPHQLGHAQLPITVLSQPDILEAPAQLAPPARAPTITFRQEIPFVAGRAQCPTIVLRELVLQ